MPNGAVAFLLVLFAVSVVGIAMKLRAPSPPGFFPGVAEVARGVGVALAVSGLAVLLGYGLQYVVALGLSRRLSMRSIRFAVCRDLAAVTGGRIGRTRELRASARELLAQLSDAKTCKSARARHAMENHDQHALALGERERVRPFPFRGWTIPLVIVAIPSLVMFSILNTGSQTRWAVLGALGSGVVLLVIALAYSFGRAWPLSADAFVDPKGVDARVLFRRVRFVAGRDALLLDRGFFDADSIVRVTLVSGHGEVVRLLTHASVAARLEMIWRQTSPADLAAPAGPE